MDRKRPKKSAGRRKTLVVTTEPAGKQRSSSVLWLKLNFTIKTARLQSLKRQKYQHLQEEALLKARGLLQNWEDGPVVLTEDLYSGARSEHEAQEILNYTPEALALRFSLRNHPDVIDAVKQLWSVQLPRDEMGCIDKKGYASLFRRIGRSLDPDATKRRLRRMEKTIQEDWNRDSKGEPLMSFATFFDSVFELADLWCETIDVDEYIDFLRRLVLRVSTTRSKRDPNNEGKRFLRSLKRIKAIDDDEESSSEESLSSDVDDEDELPSEGDSDSDDDIPVRSLTPIHSLGFIATKSLEMWRTKTPPTSAGQRPNPPESAEAIRPRSRERPASIVTLGNFSLENFNALGDNDIETPKTSTRVSSAKSRMSSARAKSPLTSVREISSADNTEDSGGVDALVTIHRLRSIVAEDSTTITTDKTARNVNLPMANIPQQRQHRPAKTFATSFGKPQTGIGVGSVNIDGLPASSGLQTPLTRSTPQLKTTDGVNTDTFENSDSSRIGFGGARKVVSSNRTKHKRGKSTDIAFDDELQINKHTMAFEGSGAKMKTNFTSNMHKKAELLPVNPTLPIYTFDENSSPTKRLLPPVQDDNGIHGRSGALSGSSKGNQQRSAADKEDQGLDFTGSYKTTGYLTGSLQADILTQSGWSVEGSRNIDARSLQQGATPLWSPQPSKETKSHRRRTSKQGLKRSKKLATDEHLAGTVSPWDVKFENDDDLTRTIPTPDGHQRTSPKEVTAIKVQFPPTISVPSAMTSSGSPSCVSELTTLPQEYHELVLGGSACRGLSRTVSSLVTLTSPTSIHPREVQPGKTVLRDPQWMLHGGSQPPPTLLQDGLEGRTMAGSPRSTLTALTSKRPRRERDVDDEEDSGLCPRFVEHLEWHGDRAVTAPSPHFRTDKLKPRCTRNDEDCEEVNFCPYHCHGSNNNWHEDVPLEQEVGGIEDVTMIVNATRGLVLRPGTMDRLAAKRAKYKQQATRSEMMRRRCQYTFAKHLD